LYSIKKPPDGNISTHQRGSFIKKSINKDQGYIQVYTGNGKGKTTAALGLCVRTAGAGKKVFIGQFIKGMHYSELDALTSIPGIKVKQYGRGCFIDSKPAREDHAAALAGLKEIGILLETGEYDVVVLDEANIALYFGLFRFEDLKTILLNRAGHVEVILTGRYAPQELIDLADLVTEMKEIKHYYTKGVEARTGVEK
jgi:cob(I)alamin adenosyltransferase